jgi:hypothetical protein
MFICPIYNHNWRNISTIYMYNKTSIKRNILTIKKKIQREVGRAKDLSAPRYSFCYRRVLSNRGMATTNGSKRTQRNPCPSAKLYTLNPQSTGLGSNPNFRGERPAINSLKHSTAHINLQLSWLQCCLQIRTARNT